jgi:2',3'-cyclic-nucleotide 2'-phosphodiesterase (5'-nucleotidase family)
VLTQGGLRIGVVGVGPELASLEGHSGVVGTPPIPAALAEARKLTGKVDLVIVLAALPLEQVLQLSKEAGDSVDLIFHSGDSKRPTVPRRDYSSFLVSSGHRGQMVVSVELDLSGEGPLVDGAELARTEQTLALLEQQLAEARQRHFQESLKGLEERKAQVQASLEGLRGRKGRSLTLSTLPLGPGVADDAGLKARVEKLEPSGTVAHDQP